MDFVAAGQAFHWFEPGKTRAEFRRILRSQGWVVAIWNFRDRETPFGMAYEDILVKYGTDYQRVRGSYPAGHDLSGFFAGGKLFERTLPGTRVLSWDELAGLLQSASYTPQKSDANFAAMMGALRELFLKHQENGRVTWNYTTHIYFGQLPGSAN